ncbi:iron-sulfur cluster carrier protein ApbC [Thaumasiovibrio sp. DFM-14]|uniref:iron-sulfur cluster carrier protein ApbC n=1 Tax=Thaumasiovibrio sp. DFM-14 TaxID=3384792 RepID=UPI00399FF8D5
MNQPIFEHEKQLRQWLQQFQYPHLPQDWAFHRALTVKVGSNGEFALTLPFAAADLCQEIEAWAQAQHIELTTQVSPISLQTPSGQPVAGVKNIIAVSSGKGGVGKSTTAVNLALALSELGAKAGILDADMYGPSIPLMLNCSGEKAVSYDGERMQPVERYGIYAQSIGFLIEDENAAVWRGPMASKALLQLLNETEWPDLDYLVVDLPPGTGDIQLTLAQQFPVTGALIVTTPQDLALLDVAKGAAMFEKVSVPVLGIVENMSYHICANCGHHEAIFGAGGAEKLSAQKGLPLLVQLPLDMQIREDIDMGCPTVINSPDGELAERYFALAEQVAAQLFWQGEPRLPDISVRQV